MTERLRVPGVRSDTDLYGRQQFLDDLTNEVNRGRTLFALEGVSGVGKSALVTTFSKRLEGSGFSGIATLNAAQLPSEQLAIASIYAQLQHLGRDPEALMSALNKRLTSELPKTLRILVGAVMADVAKLATDKAEKTIKALQGIVAGEGVALSVEAQLAALDGDNLRVFVSAYLQSLVDGGNPVVIVVDNFDAADVGLVSLVRFLIKTKPDRVTLVLAHNSEVADNTNWDYTIADLRARGGSFLLVPPLARSAISAWFFSEVGRWPTDTELGEIESGTHGRAMALKLTIDAIRDDAAQPVSLDYGGYYELSRRNLSGDARTVAELLAVVNRDATVPVDLLAAAAESLGIANIGPALDDLRDRRLLKENGRDIALAHSLAQQSWRLTINAPRMRRLAQAWFAVVAHYDTAELTGPSVTGLMTVISVPLIENRPAVEIAQIGDQLIAAGQVRSGLELLDLTRRSDVVRQTGSAGMFLHALIAARTRLDLGRYGEVDEPLAQAARAADHDPDAKVQVLLLQMKLALRRNTYAALWEFVRLLEAEAGRNSAAQIEAELVSNVAYRDLLDLEGIRTSSDKLLRLRDAGTLPQQKSIDRALARSLAKLGETDAALVRARAGVEAEIVPGSIRGVGNAHLALAEVLRYRGDFDSAFASYRRAAAIGRNTGNRDSLLWSLLGESAAYIEAGALNKTSGPLAEVRALLAEPGYYHPLETAHAGLLRALSETGNTVEDVLHLYETLGISWPAALLGGFLQSGHLGGTIPI